MKATSFEDFIKEVETGSYFDLYLIYNRKSTDELNNQKNSLKYQKEQNLLFAKGNNLRVANLTIEGFCRDGVIYEKHSAFKQDDLLIFNKDGTVQFSIERPKFQRLVELLNRRLFKGVIFLCWDRASRNPTDDLIIKRLIKMGVDVCFALATYDKTSSGNLHQDVDSMFSIHHSLVS